MQRRLSLFAARPAVAATCAFRNCGGTAQSTATTHGKKNEDSTAAAPIVGGVVVAGIAYYAYTSMYSDDTQSKPKSIPHTAPGKAENTSPALSGDQHATGNPAADGSGKSADSRHPNRAQAVMGDASGEKNMHREDEGPHMKTDLAKEKKK